MWLLNVVTMQYYLSGMRRKRSLRHTQSRGDNIPHGPQSAYESQNQQESSRGLLYSSTCCTLWFIMGILFFAYSHGDQGLHEPLGLVGGFFYAVNIGYSIGLSPPREDYVPNLWFSTFYIITGAFLVTFALGFLGEKIADTCGNWFADMRRRQEYEDNMSKSNPLMSRIHTYVSYHWASFAAIGVWIGWLTFIVVYSLLSTGWAFRESQYFAVSTSSTAGAKSLPVGSPTWLYGITGIAALLGMPIMALAMSSLVTLWQDRCYLKEVQEAITQPITDSELRSLCEVGLCQDKGILDRSEFVILCMMRMGTDPELFKFISDRFPRRVDFTETLKDSPSISKDSSSKRILKHESTMSTEATSANGSAKASFTSGHIGRFLDEDEVPPIGVVDAKGPTISKIEVSERTERTTMTLKSAVSKLSTIFGTDMPSPPPSVARGRGHRPKQESFDGTLATLSIGAGMSRSSTYCSELNMLGHFSDEELSSDDEENQVEASSPGMMLHAYDVPVYPQDVVLGGAALKDDIDGVYAEKNSPFSDSSEDQKDPVKLSAPSVVHVPDPILHVKNYSAESSLASPPRSVCMSEGFGKTMTSNLKLVGLTGKERAHVTFLMEDVKIAKEKYCTSHPLRAEKMDLNLSHVESENGEKDATRLERIVSSELAEVSTKQSPEDTTDCTDSQKTLERDNGEDVVPPKVYDVKEEVIPPEESVVSCDDSFVAIPAKGEPLPSTKSSDVEDVLPSIKSSDAEDVLPV